MVTFSIDIYPNLRVKEAILPGIPCTIQFKVLKYIVFRVTYRKNRFSKVLGLRKLE